MPEVLAAFDVSVLSSTDVETLPLAFLESMASGLPLVATRVGGVPDLIEDGVNGFLTEPRDPRSLADAMLRVLADRAVAERMGSASRRIVIERFHVDQMVRDYEDLFAELLTRKRVPLAAADRADGV